MRTHQRFLAPSALLILAGCTAGGILFSLSPGDNASSDSTRTQAVDEHQRPASIETIVNERKGVLIEGDGIGMIEHRGEFHAMETLADPAIRAQSDNTFVRQFMEQKAIARRGYAGIQVHLVPQADSVPPDFHP